MKREMERERERAMEKEMDKWREGGRDRGRESSFASMSLLCHNSNSVTANLIQCSNIGW